MSADAPVEVRCLHGAAEMKAAETLLATVWEHPPGSVEIDVSLLVALGHGGSYVAGAFVGGELAGVCVGFHAEPLGRRLHSHVTGVLPAYAGQHVGRALKAHQRAWAAERGLTEITWTYDPFVTRNAHFNLHRLGALPVEFLPDHYGALRDGLNAGVPSDRLLVAWPVEPRDLSGHPRNPGSTPEGFRGETGVSGVRYAEGVADRSHWPTDVATLPTLLRPSAQADGSVGGPVLDASVLDRLAPGDWAALRVPADIGAVAAADAELAARWRELARQAFLAVDAHGYAILDFVAPDAYLVRRPTSS